MTLNSAPSRTGRYLDSLPSVPELIDRASRRYASATAIVDGARTLSFHAVNRRTNQLAHALLRLTREPGARVALLLPNCLEYVECDLAISKAGLVRVPINQRLKQREREYLIADSGAETVIFDSDVTESAFAAAEASGQVRNLVAVGRPVTGALYYEDLITGASARLPDVVHPPERANYMLYTSGTTGRPKGAVSTNRGRLLATVTMLNEELEVRPGDAMLHVASMAHGGGAKTLPYFLRGARNITLRSWEPETFLRTVHEHRVTGSFMVPTMINELVEHAAAAPKWSTESLRTVTYGGAPIGRRQLEAALDTFGGVFVQVYGSCESPHPVLLLDRGDHIEAVRSGERLGSAGQETMLNRVRLVHEGKDVTEPGEQGEMLVRGPAVMSGYWNNPEATAEVFEDGWYRTGDVAHRDGDGFFYIVDRARELIISGGFNVYPAEVEAAILTHPAVAEVAVFGVPDEKWGEAVKAVVVAEKGAAITAEDVTDHCGRLLAGYKKPRSVDVMAELPKGPTGKIVKRELRDRYWAGRERNI